MNIPFVRTIVLGLIAAGLCAGAAMAQQTPEPLPKIKARELPGSDLLWYDIRDLGVEGRGFNDTESFYDRLPARVKPKTSEVVWNKSLLSAGMNVRFVTDATSITARWTLRKVMKDGVSTGMVMATEPLPGLTTTSLGLPHMTANGASGVDLYVRHEGAWRFLGVGWAIDPVTNQWPVAVGLDPGSREFRLYLPLFNGVDEVLIGISRNASLSPAPPYPARKAKPIVVYGASIDHGACPSRPGMTFPSILGRHLDWPVVNLGFSGAGLYQPEVVEVLPEIDASLFYLTLANLSNPLITERVGPFVRALRKAHPETPIVLAENRLLTTAFLVQDTQRIYDELYAEFRKTYDTLKAEGMQKLYYVEGTPLLGEDGEGTADTSHPNDLGMMRIVERIEPVVREALGEPARRE